MLISLETRHVPPKMMQQEVHLNTLIGTHQEYHLSNVHSPYLQKQSDLNLIKFLDLTTSFMEI